MLRAPGPIEDVTASVACRRSPWPAVQDEGLLLGHLRDRGPEALLADTGRLEPAVRHQVGSPQRGPVHVHDAGVDLPHGTHGARDVSCEDTRAEAVRRG